jgi:hypothetical protein
LGRRLGGEPLLSFSSLGHSHPFAGSGSVRHGAVVVSRPNAVARLVPTSRLSNLLCKHTWGVRTYSGTPGGKLPRAISPVYLVVRNAPA